MFLLHMKVKGPLGPVKLSTSFIRARVSLRDLISTPSVVLLPSALISVNLPFPSPMISLSEDFIFQIFVIALADASKV